MDLLDDLEDLEDYTIDAAPQIANSYPILKIDPVELNATLEQISAQLMRPPIALLSGSFEDDVEYSLILEANTLSIDLDEEILVLFKYIRDKYSRKFPELEQSLPNPIEYAKTVKVIANNTDIAKLNLEHLPNHVKMIITVTATTTKGTTLDAPTLHNVLQAVDQMLELEAAQKNILEYVESRMMLVAPNLSAIVGTGTAAKLMAVAGGLSALSKIPSCNLQVLGKTSKANMGLSAIGQIKHVGFIYYSEIVMSVPSDYRKRAAKLVAAKCALAVRIDCSKEHLDGTQGKAFRLDIEQKLVEMTEPAPGQTVKAIPVPNEKQKKRRAGKRVRKGKEGLAVTELRKQQNRMTFGEAEAEAGFGDSVVGLGMVGKETGKLRAVQADKRVKGHISKKHKTMLQHTTAISGLATSLAFTPVQGIELGDPAMMEKKRQEALNEANSRWFKG